MTQDTAAHVLRLLESDRDEPMLQLTRVLRALWLLHAADATDWHDFTEDELGAVASKLSRQLGLADDDYDAGLEFRRYLQRHRQALRAMPYDDYLRTPEWQSVRYFAWFRAGERCETCNATGPLHVHHRSYERRGWEFLPDVCVLCAGCHKTFHEHRRLAR